MGEITVIGNTVADLIFRLPRQFLHRIAQLQAITLPFGSKLSAEDYQLTPGGSGANVAVGLAYQNFEVRLITGFGNDVLGDYLESQLIRHGLTVQPKPQPGLTGLSVVFRVEGERSIVTAHNADTAFLNQELPQTGWLHLGPLSTGLTDFSPVLINHLAKTGQDLSLNPSLPTLEERDRHFLALLRSCRVIFLNLEEALVLSRLPQRSLPAEIIRQIQRLGPKIVVLTCGDKGAYAASDEGIFYVPSLVDQIARVDTTGAGDALTSGFLGAYLREESGHEPMKILEKALAAGALNAASVVGQVGAQAGLLGSEELERDLASVRLKRVE